MRKNVKCPKILGGCNVRKAEPCVFAGLVFHNCKVGGVAPESKETGQNVVNSFSANP